MVEKKQETKPSNTQVKPGAKNTSNTNDPKKGLKRDFKGKRRPRRPEKAQDEFEQRIVDIARVTRVMAGGKRMRFRACVVIGNRKGKIGYGVAKGADVTIAMQKAVMKAKKEIIDVPIVNDTIPHEIYLKVGAAKILLKPARKGKGVIAGGATRIILELSGIKNVTSKILGTNNKLNICKCTVAALDSLKKVEAKKVVDVKKVDKKLETQKDAQKTVAKTVKIEKK